jgi:hypothetical protein
MWEVQMAIFTRSNSALVFHPLLFRSDSQAHQPTVKPQHQIDARAKVVVPRDIAFADPGPQKIEQRRGQKQRRRRGE